MRFWITKNSEVPIREQLMRQIVLGILSEDLPAGHKLPSVRALARRHQIHSNTVSAAYHDLLQQGWLELRRGSGLYVRPIRPSDNRPEALDSLLTALLQTAHSHGYEPEEVLGRLEHLVRSRTFERVLIVEPEPAMREILRAELTEHLGPIVEATESLIQDDSHAARTVVVALPTRAVKIRRTVPDGVLCLPLWLRSVWTSLEGEPKPQPNVVISVVSRSPEIRHSARTMLIAVGLDPEALCDVDATIEHWQERIIRDGLVVADVVSARDLPAEYRSRIFRVVADSSITELKQLCTS